MTIKLIPKERKLKLIPKDNIDADIPTWDENEPSNRITRELTGPQKAANYLVNILSGGSEKPYKESLTPKEKEYEDQSKLLAVAEVPLQMGGDLLSAVSAAGGTGLDYLGFGSDPNVTMGKVNIPFGQRFQESIFQYDPTTKKSKRYYETTTENLGALPATSEFQALSKFSGIKAKPSNLTQKVNAEVQDFVNKPIQEQLKQFAKSEKLNQTLKESTDLGYVVIPSQLKNTTGINKFKESAVGTSKMLEAAKIKNQEVTNDLVRKYINVSETTPLDDTLLETIRKRHGKVYKEVSELKAPKDIDIKFDNVYDIKTKKNYSIPSQTYRNGEEILEDLKKSRFDSNLNWQFFKRSGDPEVRQKAVQLDAKSDRLEKELENLASLNNRDDLIPKLKEARKEIAKSHLVTKALNPITGDIDAKVFSKLVYEKRLIDPNAKAIAKFHKGYRELSLPPKSKDQVPFTVLDVGLSTYGVVTQNPLLAVPALTKFYANKTLLRPSTQKAMIAKELSKPTNLRSLLQVPSITKFTPSEQKLYGAGLSSLLAPYNEED